MRDEIKGIQNPNYKHGLSHTKEDYCFRRIKSRCNNINDKSYKDYGGRGIKVLYKSVLEMVEDIGFAPTKLHSIERINNNGNYEVGNCKWATVFEQSRNKRTSVYITHNGQTKNAQDWANELEIDVSILLSRIKKGFDPFSKIPKNNFTVVFYKKTNKWLARIRKYYDKKPKYKHIGYFETKDMGIDACKRFIEANKDWEGQLK